MYIPLHIDGIGFVRCKYVGNHPVIKVHIKPGSFNVSEGRLPVGSAFCQKPCCGLKKGPIAGTEPQGLSIAHTRPTVTAREIKNGIALICDMLV
jgi:hypothetical protein